MPKLRAAVLPAAILLLVCAGRFWWPGFAVWAGRGGPGGEEPWHAEGDEAMRRFERELLSGGSDAEDGGLMEMLEAEAEAQDVSCGGHRAPSCGECARHASWCNGDCTWERGACKPIRRHPPTKGNPFGCPLGGGRCQSRTGSVHFNFRRPSTAKSPVWYYAEVVPKNASSSTFYASNTHAYGYAGFQMSRKDPAQGDIVICSTWDQDSGKATVETCGEGVECTDFGGEGTGVRTRWRWHWTLGRRYAFMVSRSELPGGRVESACWFHAGELEGDHPGGWKHISTTTTGRSRWGATFGDAGAFLEQWSHLDSGDLRRAQYGPAYYKDPGGPWGQAQTARWSGGYCVPERVRKGLVRCDITSAGEAHGGERLYMSTGGAEQHHVENLGAKAGGRGATLDCPEHECGLPGPLNDFERHRPALLRLARARDPEEGASSRTTCGNHRARSCAACPRDGDKYRGRAWCNGQCAWKDGQCMDKPSAKKCPKVAMVSCGGHSAKTCGACPGRHGRGWCNGECTWSGGRCVRG